VLAAAVLDPCDGSEEAVGYSDAGQIVLGSGGEVPYGLESGSECCTWVIRPAERFVVWCRAQLACGTTPIHSPAQNLVVALTVAGAGEEARAAANGLIVAAEATHNSYCALVAHGLRYLRC